MCVMVVVRAQNICQSLYFWLCEHNVSIHCFADGHEVAFAVHGNKFNLHSLVHCLALTCSHSQARSSVRAVCAGIRWPLARSLSACAPGSAVFRTSIQSMGPAGMYWCGIALSVRIRLWGGLCEVRVCDGDVQR